MDTARDVGHFLGVRTGECRDRPPSPASSGQRAMRGTSQENEKTWDGRFRSNCSGRWMLLCKSTSFFELVFPEYEDPEYDGVGRQYQYVLHSETSAVEEGQTHRCLVEARQ